MAYILGFPLLILLAIFQSTLLGTFQFLEGRPDLILLAVIGWGLAGGSEEAMVWGLVGGIFLDMLSGVPIGTTSIILILIGTLVSLFERRIWEANFLMPLGVTLAGSLLFHILSLGVLLLMGREIDWTYAFSRVILPSTFINLLLALPTAQALKGLRSRLYPPEVEI
ncbi:MAG: rod shape-determining protein MreD [Anaerolineales bacterium]|nr:rod shape-determining protein MreD [Anaerolineales bacterium]